VECFTAVATLTLGLVRLSLADALDLRRVQGIDLATALAALLFQHAPGQEQRPHGGGDTGSLKVQEHFRDFPHHTSGQTYFLIAPIE
jgi:hypothetical protein